MSKFLSKKVLFIVGFLFLLGLAYKIFFTNSSQDSRLNFEGSPKTIFLNDDGLFFAATTQNNTVGDFLKEYDISLGEHDAITPVLDATIHSGARINIQRALKIEIQVDGSTLENYSTAKTIGHILAENKINLGQLDKVSPNINSSPQIDTPIVVTRINEEEKIISEDIDFKTITNTDAKMGWREEKVTQKGEKGIREIKYKITYKNNREISRVVLEKNITKEPVNQITTKGTYMKLDKASKGQGTWYSYMGGLFAASTSIPKGAYAKVTNLANGKSVVVQINDYGPHGKGRIIDLDKVAFQKIAPLGAGVVGVKVEQVLN